MLGPYIVVFKRNSVKISVRSFCGSLPCCCSLHLVLFLFILLSLLPWIQPFKVKYKMTAQIDQHVFVCLFAIPPNLYFILQSRHPC